MTCTGQRGIFRAYRYIINIIVNAFSHAGPAIWNALPDHIRTVADPVKFRKCLNHTILVKFLTFVDLRVLAFG